jgi:hypothetical protein
VAYLLKARTLKPVERAVARERPRKHPYARRHIRKHIIISDISANNVPMQQWRNCWNQCSLCGPSRDYIKNAEYFHCDPASRRRRRKGKSQISDSKICSRVPPDLDPIKTTLARASSIYKRQTRPLIREGPPEKQDRNCQRVINIWS